MLILPDSSLLNDGLLNREDATQKFKERVSRAQDKYRLPDQEHLTNAVARVGSPMTSERFVQMVRKLNPRIFVEDSLAWSGNANFYMIQNNTKVCLNAPFQKGILPEFDVIHTDDRDFPTGKTPGWRGCLQRLIANKVLSKIRVDNMFGAPSVNESSSRWYQMTRMFN